MKCPRCNAEVADSATLCQHCGSPLRPATTTFSYLPTGAPPWPSSSAQLPASLATLPRLDVSGAAQNGAIPVTPTSAAPVEARPRRSARSILVAAAILILAVVLGVGLTLGSLYTSGQLAAQTPTKPVTLPKATATGTAGTAVSPTPTTTSDLPSPSSFQSISKTGSTDLQASLQFPSDWQEDAPQTANGTTQVHFHPLQQLGIDFGILRLSSADSANFASPDALNQFQLTSIQNSQGVSNFQTITPVTPQRTIGGQAWPEQDATFDIATSGGTLQYHVTSIATRHNNVYYNIVFYTPSLVYNEALQKYFQPMFDSFKFTS